MRGKCCPIGQEVYNYTADMRFVRIFSRIYGEGCKISTWLNRDFSASGRCIFEIFRDKENNIIWLYMHPSLVFPENEIDGIKCPFCFKLWFRRFWPTCLIRERCELVVEA